MATAIAREENVELCVA